MLSVVRSRSCGRKPCLIWTLLAPYAYINTLPVQNPGKNSSPAPSARRTRPPDAGRNPPRRPSNQRPPRGAPPPPSATGPRAHRSVARSAPPRRPTPPPSRASRRAAAARLVAVGARARARAPPRRIRSVRPRRAPLPPFLAGRRLPPPSAAPASVRSRSRLLPPLDILQVPRYFYNMWLCSLRHISWHTAPFCVQDISKCSPRDVLRFVPLCHARLSPS